MAFTIYVYSNNVILLVIFDRHFSEEGVACVINVKMAATGARNVFKVALSFVGGAVAYRLWEGAGTDRDKVITEKSKQFDLKLNELSPLNLTILFT